MQNCGLFIFIFDISTLVNPGGSIKQINRRGI